MKSARSNSSLAVAAAGMFAFVVLISGVWHPRTPAGGLTQVGRNASVTFEDGTVMNLTESANDLDILKKRRMRGWNGHEYKNLFIMADGEEVDMADFQPAALETAAELSTGDHLLLAANTTDMPDGTLLNNIRHSAVLADLQTEDKSKEVAREIDGKDGVVTDLIDSKDQVLDPKDAKDATEQPVFALTADQSIQSDESLDMILLGGGGDLGNLRSPGGLGSFGPGDPGSVGIPPIGAAVPEPSALLWIGVAGVMGVAYKAWRRRSVAA